MSENICIDPRSFPIQDANTSEISRGEARPSSGTTKTNQAKDPGPLAETTKPRTSRNLGNYKAQILRKAFGDYTSPKQPPSPWDPSQARNLPSIAPFACSSESPGGSGGTDDSGAIDAPVIDSGNPADARVGSDAPTSCSSVPVPTLGQGMDSVHDTAPCEGSSIIPDLDDGIGVCAHYSTSPEDPADYRLFSWDSSTAGLASTLNQLAFAPDQVQVGSLGEYFVTTHGDATVSPPQLPGMAVINISMPEPMEHQPFPNIILGTPGESSEGRTITQIPPTFPKGLVEYGDQIFVATSNLDLSNNDFLPGTVLVYSKSSGNWTNHLPTNGYNPTSVAISNGRLYVVNTGAVDFNGVVHSGDPGKSSIAIFHPVSHELLDQIDLGKVAAGISGEIRFSPDGNTIVLPTGNNSGQLIVVDLMTRVPREISLPVAAPSKVLLTGLTLYYEDTCSYEMAYVANFNDGMVYSVNLATDEVAPPLSVDADTTDFLGLSDGILSGGQFYLGKGNQILRLPLQ